MVLQEVWVVSLALLGTMGKSTSLPLNLLPVTRNKDFSLLLRFVFGWLGEVLFVSFCSGQGSGVCLFFKHLKILRALNISY